MEEAANIAHTVYLEHMAWAETAAPEFIHLGHPQIACARIENSIRSLASSIEATGGGTGQHLVGKNLGAVSTTEKGALPREIQEAVDVFLDGFDASYRAAIAGRIVACIEPQVSVAHANEPVQGAEVKPPPPIVTELPSEEAIKAALRSVRNIEDVFDEGRLARAILTSIRTAKPSEEWRPIETAPKDGTRFMFTNGGMVGMGHYVNGHAFAADSWQGQRNTIPTHWMPLPAPPAIRTGEK